MHLKKTFFIAYFQTHLICTVPPYIDTDIIDPATVEMFIASSGKFSESHNFVYTPKGVFGHGALAMATTLALQNAHLSRSKGIFSQSLFIIFH